MTRRPLRALAATFALLAALAIGMVVLLVRPRGPMKPLAAAPALDLDEPPH